MKVSRTRIPEVLVLEPTVHEDARGYLFEAWNRRAFEELVGVDVEFLQDNQSASVRGVLRGIHYQLPPAAQGKLVRVIEGAIFDVAVDLRRSSPTCGEWFGIELTASNRRQLWIPVGFGHAFLTLSDRAEVLYKVTGYHSPEHGRSIHWADPDLGIAWPGGDIFPVTSAEDAAAVRFREAELFE